MARYIKSFANDAAIQAAVDDKTLGKPYVALNESAGTIDWNTKEETDYSKMYLTIEALSGGTFYVRNANVGYSVNGGEWETTTGETALSLNQGDTIRFKGHLNDADLLFMNNTIASNVYGNIMSLKYGDEYVGKTEIFTMRGIFFQSKLVDASNLILPSKQLSRECYQDAFRKCSSLIKAPDIPATTLADACCQFMFLDCKKLQKAPILLATQILGACYQGMFAGCETLSYVKCLATNSLTASATFSWLSGVSPTGTFVKKAGAEWETGDSGIPSGWTIIEE